MCFSLIGYNPILKSIQYNKAARLMSFILMMVQMKAGYTLVYECARKTKTEKFILVFKTRTI